MKVSILIVLLAACAHQEPKPATAAAQRTPLPVNLVVRSLVSGDFDRLLPQTERRARERLEAQGHKVGGDAPHTAEIELAFIGSRLQAAVYKVCVGFRGRVVKGEERFASVEVVKERCDDTSTIGMIEDMRLPAINSLVTGLEAKEGESPLFVRLYAGTLEDLVDALGNQATAPIGFTSP